MSHSTSTTGSQLQAQWRNPADILSILLLIGGDIVQKAIAQLTGYSFRPFGQGGFNVPITPVAFSFGWVAFGFISLLSAVGEKRLMPAVENPAIVVNCANAFVRENKSWLLERLLRDHEADCEVDTSNISIRIDIFELGSFGDKEEPVPKPDRVWWAGWLTIITQLGIAILPWGLYEDWGVMMVLLCGTLLAFITSCLPQWKQEKWRGVKLDRDNVIALTRGNGHQHVAVFIGSRGSYNLEIEATAKSRPRPETPIVAVMLAVLWICLLLCVANLKENAWFLVGIGGLGMLQNVYAAGASRRLKTTGLKIEKFGRMPTIIGKRLDFVDDSDADVILDDAFEDISALTDWLANGQRATEMPHWLGSMEKNDGVPGWLEPVRSNDNIVRTHGALKELEKWVPGAGLAMLKLFFPSSLDYEDRNVRDNVNKKFWKRAWYTKAVRRRAEQARRDIERSGKGITA